MPLWLAAVMFVICVVGIVVSFRVYFKCGGKIFLASGIAASLICLVALAYAALTLFFVWSV